MLFSKFNPSNKEEKKNYSISLGRISKVNSSITIILLVLVIVMTRVSVSQFRILQNTVKEYIICQDAAQELKDGSIYLTKQVRLYAELGDKTYMDKYFEEVKVTKRRDHGLETLLQHTTDQKITTYLQNALKKSVELMNTEYYSMRLICEANQLPEEEWPDEIVNTLLMESDKNLSIEEKRIKAKDIVNNDQYHQFQIQIESNVNQCIAELIRNTKELQDHAIAIFADIFYKLNVTLIFILLLILGIGIVIKNYVVKPLIHYNECIKIGETFPVIGSAEIQTLAKNYNHMFLKNQETQRLIRHEAEHDALTNVLNRGSFDKLMRIYEKGDASYALIILDIDNFKEVNDIYGHAIGDEILKKVANALIKSFRNIDYICRIGGDEFAVIMVDVDTSLASVIIQKFTDINKYLSIPERKMPAVTLSVGAAFSDREGSGESIFHDTDEALYYVKNNGKANCKVYGIEQ